MRRETIILLVGLLLLAACSMSTKVDSLAAERLCREALGRDEVQWTRLSERPALARELLRAASKEPEGRIAADVWFMDAANDVAICELRNRRHDFARVLIVRRSGQGWALKRVYGAPEIEIPEILEPELTPLPEAVGVHPRST